MDFVLPRVLNDIVLEYLQECNVCSAAIKNPAQYQWCYFLTYGIPRHRLFYGKNTCMVAREWHDYRELMRLPFAAPTLPATAPR
jgi:hypothetical protein